MFKTLIAFLLGGGSLAALGASSNNAVQGISDPLQRVFSWLTDWLPLPDVEDSNNHWVTRLLSNEGLTLAGTAATSALLAVSGNPKLASTALLAGTGISLYNFYRKDVQQQFAGASANNASPGIDLQKLPLEKSSYVPTSASARTKDEILARVNAGMEDMAFEHGAVRQPGNEVGSDIAPIDEQKLDDELNLDQE